MSANAIPMLAVQAMHTVRTMSDASSAISQARAEKAAGYASANAEEERVHAGNVLRLGTQRAAAVQSGFDAGTGSFATLQTQNAGNAALDELTARYQGQVTAWRSDLQVRQAKAARKGAIRQFGAALLLAGATGGKPTGDGNVGENLTGYGHGGF